VIPCSVFVSTQLELPASAQILYPFCFDNHAKPSSRNPFLSITIQNGRGMPSRTVLRDDRGVPYPLPRASCAKGSQIFFTNCSSTNASFSIASEHFTQTDLTKIPATRSFSVASAHLQKQWVMAPLKIQNSGPFPKQSRKLPLPLRTNPRRPLHPWPLSGTISSVMSLPRETFPLLPVSNSRERTTGSTARLIQQSARDRRPGPLAIRSRNPVHVLRPGKASSVRLGERSIVGP